MADLRIIQFTTSLAKATIYDQHNEFDLLIERL